MDLWTIIDEFEKNIFLDVDSKVKKKYERHVKMTIYTIALNLADNQLAHIKSCK